MKTYAAYYNNGERLTSSSGGLFSVIAKKFEVVYGVEMSSDNKYARFSRKTDDFSSLKGSKYIEAKMGDTFNQVKSDLESGKRVLFCGTICQISGLLCFLGRDYSDLFTVDIICHGVPSYKLWNKFIDGIDVKSVNFRSKKVSWQKYGMELNGEYISNERNRYMKLYLQNLALRPSCYNCVTKKDKLSDATIGDFWGIDKFAPQLNDRMGTSLFILRNQKAEELFNDIKNDLVFKEVDYNEAVIKNPAEFSSVKIPHNRSSFFNDIGNKSFNQLYKKYYLDATRFDRFLRFVKKILRKFKVKK
ncbi:MAG: Coenzyme F420 hydrogenase/dehydrogenase, beta subunit C-terminal domain [Clostridia bacterium]|nr:Coenzyme F420 hydrogenase/dehydrogenase, beta subunit C-terminal domain [Clostridia bacterium]